jgi:hypothetical protein
MKRGSLVPGNAAYIAIVIAVAAIGIGALAAAAWMTF